MWKNTQGHSYIRVNGMWIRVKAFLYFYKGIPIYGGRGKGTSRGDDPRGNANSCDRIRRIFLLKRLLFFPIGHSSIALGNARCFSEVD